MRQVRSGAVRATIRAGEVLENMRPNRVALASVCAAAMFLSAGCKVVVTGSSTYETCARTSDCNSAFDQCVAVTNGSITDSQCTRGCTDDLDCPGTGHCVSFDGVSSWCYQTCITSAICEPGWGCSDLSDGSAVCLPGTGTPPPTGIPPYFECAPGGSPPCDTFSDGCFTISVDGASRGMCTSTCTSDASCPRDEMGALASCLSFDGGGTFSCFHACATSGDCPTGFACKSSLADGTTFPPICLPTS